VGQQCYVVALGDSIIGLQAQSRVVKTMIEEFERQQADAVVVLEEVPREEVVHYGIARPRDGAGQVFLLDDLVEKPSMAEAPSNLAVAARYVFSPAIFDCLERTRPGKGGEIQLTDAIRLLIQQGGKVLGVRLDPQQRRFDIGNFESYFRSFVDFALTDPQYGPALRSHLQRLLGRA
jgi:UTP--glucose-1-phosphate uridylyltransferase